MEQKARLENWVLVGNKLLGEIYDDKQVEQKMAQSVTHQHHCQWHSR